MFFLQLIKVPKIVRTKFTSFTSPMPISEIQQLPIQGKERRRSHKRCFRLSFQVHQQFASFIANDNDASNAPLQSNVSMKQVNIRMPKLQIQFYILTILDSLPPIVEECCFSVASFPKQLPSQLLSARRK